MDIGRLMLGGWSWSGRERDVVHLNRGAARFADVSAASGLDFAEDGRALASCDWDGDGRLDLVLRNRNTPSLRFLHGNALAERHWVAFALRGVTGNRDAIGARVSVTAGGITHLRELRAGDGYLAQSSKVLHFGLGQAAAMEKVVVRWPGGAVQEFAALPANATYDLVQGATPIARPARGVQLVRAATSPVMDAEDSTRMVLRTSLPLPFHLRPKNNQDRSRGTTALVLWTPNDAASTELLHALSVARPELQAAEMNIALLCTAGGGNASAPLASDLFPSELEGTWWTRSALTALPALRAIVENLRGTDAPLPQPTVLLIDALGRLQSVHWGRVPVSGLHQDATDYAAPDDAAAPRSSFPGRWYYGHIPDLEGLSAAVRRSGDNEATGFYVLMALELQKKLTKRQ